MQRALLLTLGALLLLASGCGSGAQLPQAQVQSPGQAIFNGYETKEVDCYKCHGGAGRGHGLYPDLSKRVPELSDAELVNTINEGPGAMPSFADKLASDQKQALIEWLRDEFGAQTIN